MLTQRHQEPPGLWRLLCTEWLGLSRRQGERFWRALSRSRWSRPCAIRTALLCVYALGPKQVAFEHVLRDILAPHPFIEALEDLVAEGILPRPEATKIEEAVLHKTGANGRWKGEK